ncbi:Do family serine endopeptidase [Paucibacter sp. APW11]|uniref:Probable periplasmic serine endoprotease DegP-like n=1 Tax=Roseateles aquae TaxID=3077235 RepID=A0ABU3P6S1_9BURK|nr:Do family serine endopeptidase [Paucibacter sp. APW11]MDT8997778.1 Do family serine endopeptidase [Paucibacter sp. APW11]
MAKFNSETMIPARRLVWALAAAGVLGAAGGAGAMHTASAIKTSNSSSAVSNETASAESSQLLASASTTSTPVASSSNTAAVAPTVLPDFAQIAATRGAAVVNISVSGTAKSTIVRRGNRQAPQLDPNDPFFEFFRRFGVPGMPGGPNGDGEGGPQLRGQGSGFIVSEDGVILTNAHVVHEAQEVTVKLNDRREFKAKVLGSDPKTDVAVLKIEAKGLPTVALGNTRDLRVGEWVLAIGSPFGFENSVSAGVVSAKGRSLGQETFVPFLQTDVAINPGNSGGPLFNARGEVVGINSQIYSQSGGYQGLSFAIPIEVANRVRQQIEKGGKAQHARLGIVIQDVDQAMADSFKLDRPAGALVASIEDGSPGAKAGLRSGDVILKFRDQPIVASRDLPALLGQSVPGESARLEVWRNGKLEVLNAKLGDASEKAAQVASSDEAAAPQGKLGLALRPLQQDERREAGVREGLIVEEAGGAAAKAGVRPGDVLLAINGTPVSSVEQVRSVVAGAEKSVALLVQRGNQKIFVPVRLG